MSGVLGSTGKQMVGAVREREEPKMVPKFSGGWEDGNSIETPGRRGGSEGKLVG